MARYSDWRVTLKDVVDINRLLNDATNAVQEAFFSLTEDVGLDQETAASLLPEIGYYDTASKEQLHDQFVNRADFNREKSRLRRIIKAAEGKPRKGTISVAPDNANQLTSFYMDEYGNLSESQYARSEGRFIQSQQNRRNLEYLKRRGIEMVRAEVRDPVTGRYIYDESRHKVTVLVPKTPSMLEQYRDIVSEQPQRAVAKTDVPETAVIDMWGDEVPVMGIERHRMSMSAMRRAVEVDARTAKMTETYFDNYRTLVDTTMPTSISDEIDMYIERIQRLPMQEQAAMYEFINDNGDDAGTIEYLYWDTAQALPQKMANIINFWRRTVAPALDMEVKDAIEVTDVSTELEDFGYKLGGMYPIFAEYQRRRADEPKGKWRKRFRDAR